MLAGYSALLPHQLAISNFGRSLQLRHEIFGLPPLLWWTFLLWKILLSSNSVPILPLECIFRCCFYRWCIFVVVLAKENTSNFRLQPFLFYICSECSRRLLLFREIHPAAEIVSSCLCQLRDVFHCPFCICRLNSHRNVSWSVWFIYYVACKYCFWVTPYFLLTSIIAHHRYTGDYSVCPSVLA